MAIARRADLTGSLRAMYLVCMKRTNLVLDERLLEEAVRLSGERTYSGAVERALDDFVRRARARKILALAGSGLWQGDLVAMRDDRPRRRSSRSSHRSR
jgi:Arc/MetJ family transcription regulator